VLVEGFGRAARRGRLAHAYLFTGPAGVGKRLFAVELAKSLLCEKATEGSLQACDKCPSCVQVEAESHPDFFPAVRPAEALEFPIDLMRQLCQSFALKSARGRGKVVLIDDADDLNEESANCFLKTLEEPPPRSVLILIGSTPDRQLQTIVSRCQVIRFAPLSPERVEELLQGQGVEDSALRARLVRLSAGSPGMAMELADPALWDFRRGLLAGLTKTPIASVDLSRQWMAFVEEAGKESASQRRRAQLVLHLIVDFLDDALTVSMNGTPRRTDPDERGGLETVARRAGPDRLLEALERCLEADRQIDRRVQLVLSLEGLMDALGQKL
ncbi:MAG: DNA polymerase III subunit delta', partial [Gemmataceae bacterium]